MTIIGIAGGTGSGKTTVVKKIAKALPPHCAAVVPLDSYYNDTTGMTDEERRAINFDHPDAFDWKLLTEHIRKLKNGEAVEQPTYSYIISNRLPETVHVEPKPVIIIEGIMALHYKKLRDMMDLKIFVDTDADVRLIRNIRRDVVERGRTVDMVLEEIWLEEESPQELLEDLIRAYEAFGVKVQLTGQLPAQRTTALAFVEILREAATNGICHGHADTVEVTLSETGLRIADNGCGAPPDFHPGSGLSAIIRRVKLLGAHMTISPQPSFTLTIEGVCPAPRD